MPVPDFSDRSIAELVSLAGRVAVVTGATHGTGAGVARRLAEAGATVVITDADQEVAASGAAAMSDDGRRVIGARLDVADATDFDRLAGDVANQYRTLDIWVNNAGIYPAAPLLEMSPDEWDDVLDVNLRGAFLGSQAAARRMVASGDGGVIVNVGSISGFRTSMPGMAHYVASKSGLRGLTQALAVELGPHGIRALGVAPTFTVSEGTRRRRADLDDEEFAEYLRRVGASKPLGRVGVPDDVGRVVLFCASDLSALMTGSTLLVDAGDLA